jgi:hypothetical protein
MRRKGVIEVNSVLTISALLAALAVFPAFSQEIAEDAEQQQTEPTHTFLVPVVANIIGVGDVTWRSELVLRNDSAADVQFLLAMPGASADAFMLTTLTAGGTFGISDLAGEAFGLSGTRAPLIVQTFGRTPLTIISTVHGFLPGGGVRSQRIPALPQNAGWPRQVLRNLAFNDTTRTNIGLANLSEYPVQFSIGLQFVAGRYAETASYSVAPYTTLQLAIQTIFPILARGDDLTVVVEPSSAGGYAYASVIENETHTPRFVPPLGAATP